ncbi:nicotinate-nucleotide adenylyltransferase [Flavobacterium sp. CBA20B-1]|uniref:Probable nicotinate-nucleotide adenylyltransferase n=1 Tax=Paenimyroides aestuarii TaxID=2968490 RepID=A0ABY5NVD2_9FLAO|nr:MULTISPECIES: nicotinate (nicotinamide) nucleotide adenylyltransferase [Flavobacteriaceae]UUV22500.1 nicotinate (nicotinamide) nucleotide adenylyltransferase [Paenimyroides aestuarii]WCM41321.1 nicotinate-nucleotide adenylyltransferase [Flavobacterium sp. CBA20B-1]
MKVGLYFGTFNPIHVGHLIIANHLAENSDLDQVWMVVTPHNPLKKKAGLLPDYHRLQMVHLATEGYDKIVPSDIEFKLPQPNYTVNTLAHLHEKFPNHVFSLIMGEDNLKSLKKWKNFELILNDYELYVYPRISADKVPDEWMNLENIHKIDAPIIELSSTFIRQSIKEQKNIKPMIDHKVWEYIDHNLFYKK